MSSLTKSGISISKKDLIKSRIPPVASRNVTFYHKSPGGQLSLDLLALSMPSEMATNTQATVAEISGAQLAVNKKNLTLWSSSNDTLVEGLHYVVTSSTTIQLIGPYAVSGTDVDEIFKGSINSAPIGDLVVASAKSVNKTYTLAVGQNILNLGLEYQTGQNINDDIGSIKVFVNGVLAHRDVDYYEIDGGSGYGTTIGFYAAPTSIPYQVAVDFGVMSITNNNAIGTLESLSGSVIKIAQDLADAAGTNVTDYLTASPSEIERRTFGDNVLSLLNRVLALEAVTPKIATISGVNAATPVLNTFVTRTLTTLSDPKNIGVTLNSNQFTLPAGSYLIQTGTTNHRTGVTSSRIRNITDATTAIAGVAGFFSNASATGGTDNLSGIVTITSTKTFELQTVQDNATSASYGIGTTDYVNAQVTITKIS